MAEQSDFLTFGSLRSETANMRTQNPEKRYIEQLHSCIFSTLSAGRVTDLAKLSQKVHITGYLKKVTYQCKANPSVVFDIAHVPPESSTKPTGRIGGGAFRLSQSELTNALSQHELYVNTYRWVDWESRMANLFEKTDNPYKPIITAESLEGMKSPFPF